MLIILYYISFTLRLQFLNNKLKLYYIIDIKHWKPMYFPMNHLTTELIGALAQKLDIKEGFSRHFKKAAN